VDLRKILKSLIGSTKTTKGLRVICQADDTYYELAKKVTDEQFNSIDLVKLSPFDAWNYIVKGFK
jgi:hypothetical protein